MATSANYRQMLEEIERVQAETGNGPTNIHLAAHCEVGTACIGNWKRDLRQLGVITSKREYISRGRARIEVASWTWIHWNRLTLMWGSFQDRVRTLRRKAREWMSEAARLRTTLFNNEALYPVKSDDKEKEEQGMVESQNVLQPSVSQPSLFQAPISLEETILRMKAARERAQRGRLRPLPFR